MVLFRHPVQSLRLLTRKTPWLLLAVLALVCRPDLALAQDKGSDSKVKVTGTASKPDADGKQVVTLTVVIEKDWHLYANPVGNKDIEESKTAVSIKAGQPLKDVKVEYPAGKLVKDMTLGDYKVYEGTVVIKSQVRRTAGDTSPLEVSVQVNACNDKLMRCLLPGTVKLTVK